jgi:CheY-like chemotaxis protein
MGIHMAKLLIVDDDEAILEALEAHLAIFGHEVRSAASGEAALEAMHTSKTGDDRPDLIIADMLMPGISGLQLLEAVRAHESWRQIPFLFITAQDAQSVKELIAPLIKVSLLPKPFNPADLREAVDTAVDTHG